ncbi:MAG: alpha-galactosidase [Anaerolineales bacterium]|nr:alpha-galactosidase [Anaerolineales bacterium]
MIPSSLDLSNRRIDLRLAGVANGLTLSTLAADGVAWLGAAPSALFSVTVDGRHYDATSLTLEQVTEDTSTEGVRHITLAFSGPGFTVTAHLKTYADTALIEVWQEIRNHGDAPIRIERIDSLDLNLAPVDGSLFHYTGNWGSEFEPHRRRLEGSIRLESRSGRSSKGDHPWFALSNPAGHVLSASVAWSGNWALRFDPLAAGGWRLSGGVNDWAFFKDLAPGTAMETAPVVLVLGPDLNTVSQAYARVGRQHWYPTTSVSAKVPVEWNHWWPYEDAEINETVFAQNVARAEPMGFEVCTLDAGWFGPSDAGTFWEHYRGDWHQVNEGRFPSGLRALGDQVHARGMKFGVWCEIEGLGVEAQVARDHPEYVALRDGERVGCVCFGNPAVQEWAYQTLRRLIVGYGADWIKLDYNLDAGAGCNRTDHGHGAGDGHFEHINGYYATIERVRRDFPEVVLQACSSGGLRIDLGLARRTDMTFLSDPDWPVHDLQLFWGASTMLAPNVLLHWTYSQWRNLNPPPYQTFDPHDPAVTRKVWDYLCRISMLNVFGLSQKLPDLPAWLAQRSVEQIALYKKHVRRFVKEADLYRLTDQPRRSGEGERWVAFQYSLPDRSEHLLFVFRLPGAEPARAIRLQGLEPERLYTIGGFEGEPTRQALGRDLMTNGLPFSDLLEEDSALLKLA